MSKIKALYIAAKKGQPRRCRAGMCFDEVGHGVALDALSDEQIEALKADPLLVVEETEVDADSLKAAHADEPLDERAHTLRAYLATLDRKPSVRDAAKATGLANLSTKEIGNAWAAIQ